MNKLLLGDLHVIENRKNAINLACDSILKIIKGKKFDSIVLLGDLFHKKPTANERCMLAEFINKLRKYTKKIELIQGNGTHTFEGENIHEQDWTILCKDITQYEELEQDKYVFTHSEFKGLKYVNGHDSASTREADPNKQYISGHIHTDSCSFNNVTYVGSIYKVTFAEMNDTKRICILNEDKLESYAIESQPMLEINLVGKEGKVKGNIKELKLLKDKLIDLKIKVKTDTQSLGEIHRTINKIKETYKIEYYIEEISVDEVKTDIPKDLDQKDLLKNYCDQRKINYTLVSKEI
jgi:DNA repair exonuclease SbcCD nuclease subunit